MSQSSEILHGLIRAKYPHADARLIEEIGVKSAAEWCFGSETELADLFDKYTMLKRLHGINSANENE